jgi:hypothetical protein
MSGEKSPTPPQDPPKFNPGSKPVWRKDEGTYVRIPPEQPDYPRERDRPDESSGESNNKD